MGKEPRKYEWQVMHLIHMMQQFVLCNNSFLWEKVKTKYMEYDNAKYLV